MIRQACAWILMGVLITGVAGPALAQGTQPAPAQTVPAPVPAAKAPVVAKTKSAVGTVKSASVESLVLVASKKDKKELTFVLDKDTKITRGDKAVEAKDLTAKDSATVTYAEADGKMVAKTVKVKAAAKPKTQS